MMEDWKFIGMLDMDMNNVITRHNSTFFSEN